MSPNQRTWLRVALWSPIALVVLGVVLVVGSIVVVIGAFIAHDMKQKMARDGPRFTAPAPSTPPPRVAVPAGGFRPNVPPAVTQPSLEQWQKLTTRPSTRAS